MGESSVPCPITKHPHPVTVVVDSDGIPVNRGQHTLIVQLVTRDGAADHVVQQNVLEGDRVGLEVGHRGASRAEVAQQIQVRGHEEGVRTCNRRYVTL